MKKSEVLKKLENWNKRMLDISSYKEYLSTKTEDVALEFENDYIDDVYVISFCFDRFSIRHDYFEKICKNFKTLKECLNWIFLREKRRYGKKEIKQLDII